MQMVFEEFGFRSFLAMPAQPLSLLQWQAESRATPANAAGIGCVLDAGGNPTTPLSLPCCISVKESWILHSPALCPEDNRLRLCRTENFSMQAKELP